MAFRSIKLSEQVGAVIPVEGSDNLLAAVGRKLCLVTRETGIRTSVCMYVLIVKLILSPSNVILLPIYMCAMLRM